MKTTPGWIKLAAAIGLGLTGHLVSAIDLDTNSPGEIY